MAFKDALGEFPVLETENLLLRQLTEDDGEDFFNVWADPGMQAGFDAKGFIQAFIRPDNIGSICVAEKAGFEREGLLRRYHRTAQRDWVDKVVYARLNNG